MSEAQKPVKARVKNERNLHFNFQEKQGLINYVIKTYLKICQRYVRLLFLKENESYSQL